MSYIDANLLAGEKILFRTKKHLIVFFFPVIWLIFSFYATDYLNANPMLAKASWAPWLIACLLWAYVGLEYWTSEYVVTDKRIMMREGFFTRRAIEMRLSSIAQVNIDQSIIGQMLNYGSVSINSFGVSDIFNTIAKPVAFQRHVNAQLDAISK